MVYLLHFSIPYRHAQHYIGWAASVKRRVAHHLNGTGANLPKVVGDAGISIVLARTWRGKLAGRSFERKLKRYKKAHKLCPICSGNGAKQRMRLTFPIRNGTTDS